MGIDLAVLGKKWTFHILRNIEKHVDRFNQILRSLPGLTPRLLILRLNELEGSGLIRSVLIRERPRIVRWELTDKGRDATPIADGYASFASKWYPYATLANHKTAANRRPANSPFLLGA